MFNKWAKYIINKSQSLSTSICKILILVLLCSSSSLAHFGAKYEPDDGRVIHGLGQYDRVGYTDTDTWEYVNDYQDATGIIPTIYSVYAYVSPRYHVKYGVDLTTLVNNPSSPNEYILLVGIALFDIGSSGVGNMVVHVDSILGGYFDSEIIRIATEIKQIGAPVYVRPGYEMGVDNGGLHWSPDIPTGDIFIDIWLQIAWA